MLNESQGDLRLEAWLLALCSKYPVTLPRVQGLVAHTQASNPTSSSATPCPALYYSFLLVLPAITIRLEPPLTGIDNNQSSALSLLRRLTGSPTLGKSMLPEWTFLLTPTLVWSQSVCMATIVGRHTENPSQSGPQHSV